MTSQHLAVITLHEQDKIDIVTAIERFDNINSDISIIYLENNIEGVKLKVKHTKVLIKS